MPRTVDTWRLVTATALIGVLFLTLSWLQGRFDTADHRKAVDIVKAYHVGDGPTIEQVVVARHDDVKTFELGWTSEIISSCYGHIRVSVLVPKKPGRDAITYAFDVDLTGPSIHPTDPTTIEILRALK